eukprot:scaffold1026_cov272-Pinguiococcus_pyrenoidosus.AAC.9
MERDRCEEGGRRRTERSRSRRTADARFAGTCTQSETRGWKGKNCTDRGSLGLLKEANLPRLDLRGNDAQRNERASFPHSSPQTIAELAYPREATVRGDSPVDHIPVHGADVLHGVAVAVASAADADPPRIHDVLLSSKDESSGPRSRGGHDMLTEVDLAAALDQLLQRREDASLTRNLGIKKSSLSGTAPGRPRRLRPSPSVDDPVEGVDVLRLFRQVFEELHRGRHWEGQHFFLQPSLERGHHRRRRLKSHHLGDPVPAIRREHRKIPAAARSHIQNPSGNVTEQLLPLDCKVLGCVVEWRKRCGLFTRGIAMPFRTQVFQQRRQDVSGDAAAEVQARNEGQDARESHHYGYDGREHDRGNEAVAYDHKQEEARLHMRVQTYNVHCGLRFLRRKSETSITYVWPSSTCAFGDISRAAKGDNSCSGANTSGVERARRRILRRRPKEQERSSANPSFSCVSDLSRR